jgi:hypothetical protein
MLCGICRLISSYHCFIPQLEMYLLLFILPSQARGSCRRSRCPVAAELVRAVALEVLPGRCVFSTGCRDAREALQRFPCVTGPKCLRRCRPCRVAYRLPRAFWRAHALRLPSQLLRRAFSLSFMSFMFSVVAGTASFFGRRKFWHIRRQRSGPDPFLLTLTSAVK